jgi:signal transduction histidine kinase
MTEVTLEQARRLLTLSDDALFVFSIPTGAIVFANAAMGELSGFSVEELKADARGWLARVHPDDRAIASGTAAWQVEREARSRYRYHHPARGERTYEARLAVVEAQQVVVGVVRDVTDSVVAALSRNRYQLFQSEDFAAVVAGLPVAIVLSRGGAVVLANRAALRHFPLLVEASPTVARALPPALAALDGAGKAECGVFTVHSSPLRHLSFVAAPLVVDHESYTMWTITDDTDRIETDRRVASVESQRNLLERSLLVSEISAFVTHELSQPLASITAWVEGALARLDRPGAGQTSDASIGPALQQALIQCQRAAELVGRVRRLIVTGDVRREVVLLEPLVQRAMRSFRASPVRFEGLSGPRVFVDPMYVEVALMTVFRSLANAGLEGLSGVVRQQAGAVVLDISTARPGLLSTQGPHLGLELAVATTALEAVGGSLQHRPNEVVVSLPAPSHHAGVGEAAEEREHLGPGEGLLEDRH